MSEIETIDGFDIPKRELTEEEANRDITLERFQEFHHIVGEDFADQLGHTYNHRIFGGYLMHKYPSYSSEILEVLNNKYGDLLQLQQVYEDDENCDKFYSDFAEFLNLTVAAKKRANQILIQISEHYAD